MCMSIFSYKRAFMAALATAAMASMLGVSPASATNTVTNLVANGNFIDNAGAFGAFPGYVGGSNPASITDWTSIIGNAPTTDNTGINLDGGAPFSPDTFVFAFMQGSGSGLSQQIGGLTVGQAYTVSYLAASRDNGQLTVAQNAAQALTASVTNGSQVDGSLMSTGSNTAPGTVMVPNFFETQLFGFTASASTETLTFTNSSSSTYDTTVDVSGVVIDPMSTAVPEPASLAILGISAVGLLLFKRRKTA